MLYRCTHVATVDVKGLNNNRMQSIAASNNRFTTSRRRREFPSHQDEASCAVGRSRSAVPESLRSTAAFVASRARIRQPWSVRTAGGSSCRPPPGRRSDSPPWCSESERGRRTCVPPRSHRMLCQSAVACHSHCLRRRTQRSDELRRHRIRMRFWYIYDENQQINNNYHKMVDELARALPSFKRPLLSVVTRHDGWHVWQHWTLSRLTLLISCRRCELAHFMLHATKQGVATVDEMKSAEFWLKCGSTKCFFSQSSKPNELIFFNTMFCDSVCFDCIRCPHG